MELKDFVAQTITEITRGILQAQEENKDTNLIIAPHVSKEGTIAETSGRPEKPSFLHFELNIAATSSSSEDGELAAKFKLQVVNFSMEIGGKSKGKHDQSDTSIQQVSFDLPVVWPTRHEQKEQDKFTPLPEVKPLGRIT